MQKYLILLTSMALAVIGQTLLKKGVVSSTLAPTISSIIRTLSSPLIILGFGLYVVSGILWLFVLQRFPLSVAVPTLSLSYVVILFISYFFFDESLAIHNFIGIFAILFGLYILHH